jgi:hypothetical protein
LFSPRDGANTLPDKEWIIKTENVIPALKHVTPALTRVAIWPINVVLKLWRGEYPLGLSFWWYCVFGVFPFCLLLLFVSLPFLLFGIPAFRMLIPLYVFYLPLAAVGVWRSADSYNGEAICAVAAKIAVVIQIAGFIGYLASGGLMHILDFATRR